MLRLKELRKARGLTQEELIEQFNERYGKRYAASSLSMFENGKPVVIYPTKIEVDMCIAMNGIHYSTTSSGKNKTDI